MRYPVAERFKAPQGEGLFTGVPMAFVRLVGCSVGQGVCTACDTDFDKVLPAMGGGLYEADELSEWAAPYQHVCLTGGEPLDRDIRLLVDRLTAQHAWVHVETSGTVKPSWLVRSLEPEETYPLGLVMTDVSEDYAGEPTDEPWPFPIWLTVSPKPGWLPEMIELADEVKVILGGLGDGPGWPTLEDAVRWADAGKLVYVQPRNHRAMINGANLESALAAVDAHPQLRLSMQAHKFVGTR